jgi:hypothetical protein
MRVAYQAAGVGQIWHKKEKCPSSEDMSHSRLWSNVAREWCPWLVIRRTCCPADIGQMWKKLMPLVGGLCLTADFDQMWSKMCPSLEDFVTQPTLTKCGPNCAPRWRTLSLVMQLTSTKCGPKCAPCWRTLSHHGLWPNVVQKCAPHWRTLSCSELQPNVVQNVPLVGGLCLTVNSDQMWSEMCPSSEDFVSLQILTKCGPNICPLSEDFVTQRTLTKCSPNMCPWWRTLFCYGVWPHMDQQCTHHRKRPVPNKRILSIDRCGTETTISNYIAIWSIH